MTFGWKLSCGTPPALINLTSDLPYPHSPLPNPATPLQDQLPPGSLGDLAPDRDMTFEEKRKLSAHMASLPGEKLVAVLDIIQEGEVSRHTQGGGGAPFVGG